MVPSNAVAANEMLKGKARIETFTIPSQLMHKRMIGVGTFFVTIPYLT
jgi:hypothetical protein